MTTLVEYSFTGSSLTPTSSAANITGGTITSGAGPSAMTVQAALGYSTDPVLQVTTGSTSYALAITNSSYFTFTVAVAAGFTMDITGISMKAARGGAGTPRGLGVRSSVDSYAADILPGQDATTVRTTWATYSSTPSLLALTGTTTIRVYVYAQSNTIEFDDITFTGAVNATVITKSASDTGTGTDVVSVSSLTETVADTGTFTDAGTVSQATSSLVDDFSSDDKATLWPDSNGSATIASGVGTVTDTGGLFPQFGTNVVYNAQASYLAAKMTTPTTGTGAVSEVTLNNGTDGYDAMFEYTMSTGLLNMHIRNNYVDLDAGVTLAVTAGNSIWCGFAEGVGASQYGGVGIAGNLYWYTSTTGLSGSWTLRKTTTTPPTWLSAVRVILAAHNSSGTTTATFDNVNSFPLSTAETGSSAIVTGTTGALTRKHLETASSAIAAGDTGALTRKYLEVASSAVVTGVSGTLSEKDPETSTVAIVTGVTGAITLTVGVFIALVGACAIATTDTGAVTRRHNEVGASALVVLDTGAITRTRFEVSTSALTILTTGSYRETINETGNAGINLSAAGDINMHELRFPFSGPLVYDVPVVGVERHPMDPLLRHYAPGARGQSIWVLKDGTITLNQPAFWELVDHVYYGGHEYLLTPDEVALLTGAGFGALIGAGQ